jgi:hypothetical protein
MTSMAVKFVEPREMCKLFMVPFRSAQRTENAIKILLATLLEM